MNLLITGGAGYIGSVLVEDLIKKGYFCVVIDSLETGHKRAVDPKAIFFHGDYGDISLLKKIFLEFKIDAVIHLAAYTLVSESTVDPGRYLKNNLAKGIMLLDEMVKAGIKKIVFSSSASVYGEPKRIPIDEEDPLVPTSPYGLSKKLFEEILEWYKKIYGLKYVSFRYFNASGASAKYGEDHHPETHLIPNIIERAYKIKKGIRDIEPFHIYGNDYNTHDGTCIRDYIHVKDISKAHILALENLSKLKYKIFNLGNGSGYSVMEVFKTTERITGVNIPFVIDKRRPGDPAILVASANRVKKELGWKTDIPDLSDIINSAWKWKLNHPNGYNVL
ncbi:MAG: UDP-glucose 4-epimerase GalE [Spirochaetes bacterium]|nr:MAG: UDP-glucose 4-epimerase GalE [Spirochaetota bacterium]